MSHEQGKYLSQWKIDQVEELFKGGDSAECRW